MEKELEKKTKNVKRGMSYSPVLIECQELYEKITGIRNLQ